MYLTLLQIYKVEPFYLICVEKVVDRKNYFVDWMFFIFCNQFLLILAMGLDYLCTFFILEKVVITDLLALFTVSGILEN